MEIIQKLLLLIQLIGYGSHCVSSGRPDRNPGMLCGCGSGDSGCSECGCCRTCAGEEGDIGGKSKYTKKCENDHLFLNEKAQKTIPKLQFRIRFVIPSHEQIKRNHWNRFYRFLIDFDFDHFLGTIHILRQHNFGLFLTHQTHLRC